MTDLAHKDWNGWRVARWTGAAIVLLVPAPAMQIGRWAYRAGIATALGAAFLLVWINAVGIVGGEHYPCNAP